MAQKQLKKDELIGIIDQILPELSKLKITLKQRSSNGNSFLLESEDSKYWLKLVNSSQMEDSVRGVEKQALQEIRSPYVISLIDVKTKVIGGQRYDALLFEYIEGRDLADIVKDRKKTNKPLSEKEARKLLIEVGMGIDEIWNKGWIHQDIKQKNIMYDTKNNRYTILDLGIAYYSKDFQQTTGKHNRDYASAEQVMASIDKIKVPRITYNSDISQLGQLVYELLTFKNPFKDDGQFKLNFQRIIEGKYVPIKKLRPDISDSLSKIISTMLNPHPGYRYRSPKDLLSALEGKKYKIPSDFEKGVYFQIWKGPQGYKKNISQVEEEIKGVVISASQKPANSFVDKLMETKLKIIFDPETYMLTDDIHSSWHGDLQNWSWYRSLKPSYFKTMGSISSLVAKIVQTQLDYGVEYIIPPYFNISNPDSEWRNLNGLFYQECLQYCRRISLEKPVICPIMISQHVLTVDRSRKEIVDFFSQLPDLQTFFLRIDAKEHNTSIPIIQATSKLIQELEHHRPVLLADAGTIVFGYFAKGLSACVTSLVESKRLHDSSSKQVDKPSGGGYKEKFYIPKIFQFVKVDGDLPSLVKIMGSSALCNCRVCKSAKADRNSFGSQNPNEFISRWGKTERGNHFFSCISEWHEKMKLIPEEKARMSEYKTTIDEARKVYAKLKRNLIFNQIIKREDCASWEVAFFSK